MTTSTDRGDHYRVTRVNIRMRHETRSSQHHPSFVLLLSHCEVQSTYSVPSTSHTRKDTFKCLRIDQIEYAAVVVAQTQSEAVEFSRQSASYTRMKVEMKTRNIQRNGFVTSNREVSGQGVSVLKASKIADINGEPLEAPIRHVEEPLLNYIPKSLFPTYRSVPWLLDVSLIFVSLLASAVTTWKRITWIQPLAILKGWKAVPTVRELLAFSAKVSG